MILPAPRASMSRPNSRARMNWALRSISMILSQYSSGCSAAGLRRMLPPLLTRISMGGHSRFTSSTNARTAVRSLRSQANPQYLRPQARTSCSMALPAGSSAALVATISAPAWARPAAMALPIPRRAPVTRAVLPVSLKRSSMDIGILLSHIGAKEKEADGGHGDDDPVRLPQALGALHVQFLPAQVGRSAAFEFTEDETHIKESSLQASVRQRQKHGGNATEDGGNQKDGEPVLPADQRPDGGHQLHISRAHGTNGVENEIHAEAQAHSFERKNHAWPGAAVHNEPGIERDTEEGSEQV